MPVLRREKDLEIALPDDAFFRFEERPTYARGLSGAKLKEMDFGYFDAATGKMILVEFSSYARSNEDIDNDKRKNLLAEMIAKGRDSLLMLQAAWRGIGVGSALCCELPDVCRQLRPLQLCFVLKMTPAQTIQLHMTNTQGPLRSAVRASANLLGLDVEVHLLDHHQAMQRLPISQVPS